MKYEDRLLWKINKEKNMEINKEIEKNKNIIRPKNEYWNGRKISKSGIPSELYTWMMYHEKLKYANQENEIDINEIKAALKGVKNKWTNSVLKHPKIFIEVIQNKKYDWNKFVELRNEK